jgi:hypothetical protein
LQGASGATEESLHRSFRSAFGLVVHLDHGPGGRRIRDIVAIE